MDSPPEVTAEDWLLMSVAVLILLGWLAAIVSLAVVALDPFRPWWARVPAALVGLVLFSAVIGYSASAWVKP